jgi:beta-phosphoglucomutase-like phosphatase (HAD superfamily)
MNKDGVAMGKIDVRNKVLLLDFDGTLVDTEKLAIQVIEDYCVDKNLISQVGLLKNISRTIVGRTWKSAIEEMIRLHSLDLDAHRAEHELKDRYYQVLNKGVEWIPGVREKLLELKSKALFLGMVTGSSKNEVDVILGAEGNAHLFDQIWSSESYSVGKPSPEPFLNAFEQVRLNLKKQSGKEISPQDVLVFEDSVAGMESAYRAGFSFVQVLHSHPGMTFDSRALFSIQDWQEIQFE